MSYRLTFDSKRKNKFNAKSQNYGGRWYHSKKEASYAMTLDWQLKAKEIKEWEPQVKLSLYVNEKLVTNYYVDFKVVDKHGAISYHEVKGFATAEWQLKWKLLQAILSQKADPFTNVTEGGQHVGNAELIVIK